MARRPKTLDSALAAVEKKIQTLREARCKRMRELYRLLEELDNLITRWVDDADAESSDLEDVATDLKEKTDELDKN